MKKFFTQILAPIGFVVALIGFISGYKNATLILAFSSIYFIAAVLAAGFVFAKNETVKNMGYILCAVAGTGGVVTLLNLLEAEVMSLGSLIVSIGLIIMLIPALLYAIIQFFSWCGFTRKKSKADADDIATALNQYKTMEKEKILSTEEFDELKSNLLKNRVSASTSFDDLKKWKKLLDQQIITEEEFANLKAQAFKK